MTVKDLLQLLADHGHVVLPGDGITLIDHSLQTAALATRAHAPAALVVAALLHDVGHLVDEEGRLGAPRSGGAHGQDEDDHHEQLAADLLASWFAPEVVEPVRLHVSAKRYLAATDERYAARLAPMLAQSLGLQGGAMTGDERAAFEASPWCGDAVQLRRWDDAAQVPNRPVLGLDAYAEVLVQLAG